jgi:hypothetical protein
MNEDQTKLLTPDEKLDLILKRLASIEERLQRLDGHLGAVLLSVCIRPYTTTLKQSGPSRQHP